MLRAGLPAGVPAMTLDRQGSSGLMAIATATKQIIGDRMDVVIAGGVESISLVQSEAYRLDRDPWLTERQLDAYMPMLDTAEIVAGRYGIGIVTAGNASQLSDGAACSVLMEARLAERRGLAPLGRYVGIGCPHGGPRADRGASSRGVVVLPAYRETIPCGRMLL